MDHREAEERAQAAAGVIESLRAAPVVHPDEGHAPVDEGATTAEYAITTLAACGFAALLVVILTSEPVRAAVEGIITTALSLGG